MKYLCLIYEAESHFDAMRQEEWSRLRQDVQAYAEELRASGHLQGGNALQSARNAVTLRVRNGQMLTTDGPFAESKEQLGGFLLIEARDLNEAMHIAGKWPSARFGSIEVRPIETELRVEGRYAPLQPDTHNSVENRA